MNNHQQFTHLLEKLTRDWKRASGLPGNVSRIDKDILIEDLRLLYDLVFDIETKTVTIRQPKDNIPKNGGGEAKHQNPEADVEFQEPDKSEKAKGSVKIWFGNDGNDEDVNLIKNSYLQTTEDNKKLSDEKFDEIATQNSEVEIPDSKEDKKELIKKAVVITKHKISDENLDDHTASAQGVENTTETEALAKNRGNINDSSDEKSDGGKPDKNGQEAIRMQNPTEIELEITAENNTQIFKKNPERHISDHKLYAADKFKETKKVADNFQDDLNNSIASRMQTNSVTDIKAAIFINDKYLFINEIFNGKTRDYSHSIDQLNKLNSYHEALEHLEKIKQEYKVSNQNAYKRLLEIVKRKF